MIGVQGQKLSVKKKKKTKKHGQLLGRYMFSALTTELSSQLGAGIIIFSKE